VKRGEKDEIFFFLIKRGKERNFLIRERDLKKNIKKAVVFRVHIFVEVGRLKRKRTKKKKKKNHFIREKKI